MRRSTPLLAVLAFVAAVLACDPDPAPPPDGGGGGPPIVPAAHAADVELAAQAADSFDVLATWRPVVFLEDTVRSYVRSTGRDDGSWTDEDTISAVGSETFSAPSPPAGSTATYFYCLRSRGANEVGDTVTTPDSLAACAGFQYTAPTSTPPPPDSLEVDPQQTLALDSLVLQPTSLTVRPLTGAGVDSTTEIVQVYDRQGVIDTVTDTAARAEFEMQALLYADGAVVGCDGYCDTVPISAGAWQEDGVPVYIAGRDGYDVGEEWVARRLPWLRQLTRSEEGRG